MYYSTHSDGFTIIPVSAGLGEQSKAVVLQTVPVLYIGEPLAPRRCAPIAVNNLFGFAARFMHALADSVDELRFNLEQTVDQTRYSR